MIKESKKIKVQRVPNTKPLRGTGDDPKEYKKKIGSSMRNGSTLMGLNDEELRLYLHQIIGTSPSHQDWDKNVKDYYNNISVEVPYNGLELEIGFGYDNKGDQSARKNGRPLNIADYVLYRYCLEYSCVANNFEDINKSANIVFYISDKEADEERQFEYTVISNKAKKLYLDMLDDETKMDNVLTVYGFDVNEMTLRTKTLELERLHMTKGKVLDPSNAHAKKFVDIATDSTLQTKAYIERCVNAGVLRRIDNTDTLVFRDNVRIGTSMEAAVSFITDETNSKVATEIKASYQHSTSAKIEPEVVANQLPSASDFDDGGSNSSEGKKDSSNDDTTPLVGGTSEVNAGVGL